MLMMLPFPALLLTDFSIILISCLKLTSVQALKSIQQKQKSLVHHHLTPQLVGISLKTVNFIYLDSNLSFSGDLTNEIQRHINLASSAFGRLSKRVFGNQNLMIHTKIVVCNAVIIPIILYGCETWVPCRCHQVTGVFSH